MAACVCHIVCATRCVSLSMQWSINAYYNIIVSYHLRARNERLWQGKYIALCRSLPSCRDKLRTGQTIGHRTKCESTDLIVRSCTCSLTLFYLGIYFSSQSQELEDLFYLVLSAQVLFLSFNPKHCLIDKLFSHE